VAGLAATAQNGVLIKGGAYLEALGNIGHIFFDKTGTLSEGNFKLLHLDTVGELYSRQTIFEYLSLMEERASHPLAQALVHGAKAEGVKFHESLFVKNHTFLPGEGISGEINELQIYVGNKRLFSRLELYGSLPSQKKAMVDEWESEGATIGFMSIGNSGIVCLYCVADAVRPEAKEVLQQFFCMNIEVSMLTGDRREAALTIGKQVGLTDNQIKSELLPEEKLAIVTNAQEVAQIGTASCTEKLFPKRKLVLMCGDGVNDAPSLAAVDVGVAMGTGATLAMETADVTLMDSNLTKLLYSIQMGRRVINKIIQNVAFSLFVKFIVLGFALTGRASLWAAIASDVGAMILVTLNGMSLLPLRRKKESSSVPVTASITANVNVVNGGV
jgi:Cd2+/Zn2+-exporting ATPase